MFQKLILSIFLPIALFGASAFAGEDLGCLMRFDETMEAWKGQVYVVECKNINGDFERVSKGSLTREEAVNLLARLNMDSKSSLQAQQTVVH